MIAWVVNGIGSPEALVTQIVNGADEIGESNQPLSRGRCYPLSTSAAGVPAEDAFLPRRHSKIRVGSHRCVKGNLVRGSSGD